MDDEAREYWQTFEAETGEKVEARSMGALHGEGGPDTGIWGLLVLTDKSFRFRHLPTDNWLASLFRAGKQGSASGKAFEIVIARGDILELARPKGGFFSRLFSPPYPRFSLRSRGAEGEKIHEFSTDSSGGFLAALEAAIAGKP